MSSLSVFGDSVSLSRSLLVSIPPEQVNALIAAIVDLAEDGDIRSQDGRFSVFDLIERVAGKGGHREAWKRFAVQHPEVVAKCDNLKFPGAGQRPTPVADLAGCIEIIWLLPGDKAKKFRKIGAQVFGEVVKQAAEPKTVNSLDVLELMVRQLREQEQRQLELDRRQSELEQQNRLLMGVQVRLNDRVGEIEFIQSEAHRELIALPSPTEDVPVETIDMKIRRLVNNYCAANAVPQESTWRNLYQQFYYRYHRRVEKRGRETKLQAFVRLGLADQLYDLAIELLSGK